MNIGLSDAERKLLKRSGVDVPEKSEYSIEQSLTLLESVYTAEANWARKAANSDYARTQAEKYAVLADRIYALIPEE